MNSHHIHQRSSNSIPVMQQGLPMALSLDQSRMMVSSKKLQNMNCILEPSDSLGGVYLGDIVSTIKQDLIRHYKIKAILTCVSQNVTITSLVPSHKILPIKDLLNYPIINHFDQAIKWIDEKRAEKVNVLVHCHAGVSRSASIVVAYLIKKHGWNPVQSLQFVKQRRERVKPNAGFWNQLNDYYNFWRNKAQQTEKNSPVQHSILHRYNSKENLGQIQPYHNKISSQQLFSSNYSGQNKKVQQKLQQKLILQESLKQKKSVHRRRKIFEKNDLLEDKVVNNKNYATPIKNSEKLTNFQTNSSNYQNQSTVITISESNFKGNQSDIYSKMSMRQPSSEQNNMHHMGVVSHNNYFSPPSHFSVHSYGYQPRCIVGNSSQIRSSSYLSPFQIYPSILLDR